MRRRNLLHCVRKTYFELAFIVAGNLLDDGRNGTAWTTPRRPKVDQDRLRRLQDFLLKRAVSNLYGLCHDRKSPLRYHLWWSCPLSHAKAAGKTTARGLVTVSTL